MWKRLAELVLKYRLALLILLALSTGVMGYLASKVKLSYDFARAIPVDNIKYQEYQEFRNRFGDDGNMLVIGVQTNDLFKLDVFNAYKKLHDDIKKINDVTGVLDVPSAVNLVKDSITEKLNPVKIFADTITTQAQLDEAKGTLLNLPFYRSLLYNPETNAYLIGVSINKDSLNSPKRTKIVDDITAAVSAFQTKTKIETHLSGLPLIRTVMADRIKKEMKIFLIGSILLSALILLLFFRSVSTMLLSLLVVIFGVVWSMGLMELFQYKITLLTALAPSLIVVIGIPNCIYFINKYHTSYLQHPDKKSALVSMVSKMGIVTLFCNITAAIGFAVFALTKSALLKEFGVIAGISIMLIFVISFILLPAALSYLPPPNASQTKYLSNKWITSLLIKIEGWVFEHKKTVYSTTLVLLVFAVIGIFKLQSVGYIVDDLPQTDKIYTDLKFFERNFKGVMPLEIVIDSKKRYGLSGMRSLVALRKVDSLATYINSQKNMARPLSIAEGLKFAKQAFYDGDSANYSLPSDFEGAFVADYLKPKKDSSSQNNFTKMLSAFMDTSKRYTRVSINMADVGTKQLPIILDSIQHHANELFNSSQYKVTLTGTSITFLEGSDFIIKGLEQSIFWAFLLISVCMLYLFKSVKILVCSLIPNLVPLVITAGVMGWAGVHLKPSTVLVFSVALGIAIDITIRFLVNYKQELPTHDNNVAETVAASIKNTGLSIVYTSLVLIAGFVIFCFSGFGGTQSLGWLTSVTLLVATLTNLILLPALLLLIAGKKK
ncbi:efflux RND transporter permease subunit [Ferruginibacter albus]|uniref:efflux RND transporter permease subunit n=1 Tax=Ferruginibacter albus TaxID=2875540 RepID=UPI001CC577FE|nr:MMPL family transporter [Ferruginibacter albus]UAY51913.1 MMPL family transporter [Ferruginibacter albus]